MTVGFTWEKVSGSSVGMQETPQFPPNLSASFADLIDEISLRFELGPWLRAGEDTIRNLDKLFG